MTEREKKLAEKLTQIAPQITGRMRMEAALELAISKECVTRYLKGAVGKEAVGEKLLTYFETKLAVAA